MTDEQPKVARRPPRKPYDGGKPPTPIAPTIITTTKVGPVPWHGPKRKYGNPDRKPPATTTKVGPAPWAKDEKPMPTARRLAEAEADRLIDEVNGEYEPAE